MKWSLSLPPLLIFTHSFIPAVVELCIIYWKRMTIDWRSIGRKLVNSSMKWLRKKIVKIKAKRSRNSKVIKLDE